MSERAVTKGNFMVTFTFCYLWQKTAILRVTKGNTPLIEGLPCYHIAVRALFIG